MWKLSDYVDVAELFATLAKLPEELAAARGHVWDATRDCDDVARAIADLKDPTLKAATRHDLGEMDAELEAAKDTLANVKDKASATAYTIQLIAALSLFEREEAADRWTQDKEDREASRDNELPIPF